jgi:hypothetical protein
MRVRKDWQWCVRHRGRLRRCHLYLRDAWFTHNDMASKRKR